MLLIEWLSEFKMNLLITGGNGLIGSHLSEKLIEGGHSLTLFDITFNSNTRDFACEKTWGDVKDYEAVRRVVEGKDAVFHFAAVSRVVVGQQEPLNCWQT